MAVTIGKVLGALEKEAPAGTAERWDNVGLLAGSRSWETSGAVVSIDLTEGALKQAIDQKSNLIVTHHPCIFPAGKGLNRVTDGASDLSPLILEALTHKIAVASYHTNFDQGSLAVAEEISGGLGFAAKGRVIGKLDLVKLAVFVPLGHLEKLRAALFEAGAGQIGLYDSCSFGTEGTGTFRGGEGSNPFLGKPGELEKAPETKLEVVLPKGLQSAVLKAMFEAHPYEEVAFDLYPVLQSALPKGLVRGIGYGVWGEFEQNIDFTELAERVKRLFKLDGFIQSGPTPKKVGRVAYTPGAGTDFVDTVAKLQCDVFITGEIGYHHALRASRQGLTVFELGHRESEYFFPIVMAKWLETAGLQVTKHTEPTQILRC